MKIKPSIAFIVLLFILNKCLLSAQDMVNYVGYEFTTITGIVADSNSIWIATNEGLYNPVDNSFLLKGIPIRYILKDSNGIIWTLTQGDTIRCMTMQGKINTQFHYLNNKSPSEDSSISEYITSISANTQYFFVATSENKVIRYSINDAKYANPIWGHEISTNVNTILSVFAEKPELSKEYSIVVCGADGLYTGKPEKDTIWKLKRVSKTNISLPDIPVKLLKSSFSDPKGNLFFWLIGWNGYSSIAGQLVVYNSTQKTLFIQSDCLGKTTEQPYDFALTKDENLWIATANGLVYYTLKATCNHLTEKDSCKVQGIKRINKATFPEFPLRTVHHIAVQNDSTIWFASNHGFVYRYNIKKDTTEKEKLTELKVSVANKQFNFLTFRPDKKKQHLEFPDYSKDASITSKIVAKRQISEIKKLLSKEPAYQLHILAYSSAPSKEYNTTDIEIATARSVYLAKQLKGIKKERIKIHIMGYLPVEQGGPSNPDIIKAIVVCNCKEFELPVSVE